MPDRSRHIFPPVAFFRACFGALLALEVARYFALCWIEWDFVEPEFHFVYFGLDGLHPWPEPWIQLHFALLGAFAIGLALGVRHRWCAGLFAVGFGLAFLWEESTHQNRNYLIVLIALVLAWVPSTRRPCGVPRWGLNGRPYRALSTEEVMGRALRGSGAGIGRGSLPIPQPFDALRESAGELVAAVHLAGARQADSQLRVRPRTPTSSSVGRDRLRFPSKP